MLYIVSDIDKSLEFEWTAQGLREDFDLHFLLFNSASEEPALARFLGDLGIRVSNLIYKGKLGILNCIRSIIRTVSEYKPHIVHTHLQKANLLGLTAACVAGVPVRVYTRHHSSYNHVYHPSKVYYDHYCNIMATDIVAVSPMVRDILIKWEGVPESKIHVIPHGLHIPTFNEIAEERLTKLREKYLCKGKYPIVGVISRFEEWKGLQYTIEAFSHLLSYYPNAYLIVANANMDPGNEINRKLCRLPSHSYCKIVFEYDVPALYKIFDLFIHVPIDEHSEAFGQVYIGAMAAGIPLICTISGIAHELIRDGGNALVVPYKDSDSILKAILTLMEDRALRQRLVLQAKHDVQNFSIERKVESLKIFICLKYQNFSNRLFAYYS